jgi:hypothetical protein
MQALRFSACHKKKRTHFRFFHAFFKTDVNLSMPDKRKAVQAPNAHLIPGSFLLTPQSQI